LNNTKLKKNDCVNEKKGEREREREKERERHKREFDSYFFVFTVNQFDGPNQPNPSNQGIHQLHIVV